MNKNPMYQSWLPPWDCADPSTHWVSLFTSHGSVLKPSLAFEKWLYSRTAWRGSVFPASPCFNMTCVLFALVKANGISISIRDQKFIGGWRRQCGHYPFSCTTISYNASAYSLVVTPFFMALILFFIDMVYLYCRKAQVIGTNWSCCITSCTNMGQIPEPNASRPKGNL